MKKLILILVIGAAAAASITYFKGTNKNTLPGGDANSALGLVPADTLFFWGGVEPFPLKEYMDTIPRSLYKTAQSDATSVLEGFDLSGKEDGVKLLTQLYKDYTRTLNAQTSFTTQFGLAEQNLTTLYFVGLLPVLRAHLDGSDTFSQFLASAEQSANINGKSESIDGVPFKRYALMRDNEKYVDLIIAIQKNYAVFTLSTHFETKNSLAIALGAQQPVQAMASSDQLPTIIKRYQLNSGGVFYLSLQQMIDSYFSEQGSQFRSMLDNIAQTEAEVKQTLEQLTQNDCKKELITFGANWPGVFGGYRSYSFDTDPTKQNFALTIEYNDETNVSALSDMQGHIPAHLNTIKGFSGLFGMAIGLNMNAILPSLTTIWQSVSNAQYQCPLLHTAHQEMMQANPASLAAMTGMIAGLRGISIMASDMKIDSNNPQSAELDAYIALSADNPELLLTTLSTLVPGMQGFTVPKEGEVATLPIPPLVPGLTVQITRHGNHVIVFTGEKSKQAASQFKDDKLNSNGLSTFLINYKKLFTAISSSLEQHAPLPEADKQKLLESFESLKQLDMSASFGTSITENGLEIDMHVSMPKPD